MFDITNYLYMYDFVYITLESKIVFIVDTKNDHYCQLKDAGSPLRATVIVKETRPDRRYAS